MISFLCTKRDWTEDPDGKFQESQEANFFQILIQYSVPCEGWPACSRRIDRAATEATAGGSGPATCWPQRLATRLQRTEDGLGCNKGMPLFRSTGSEPTCYTITEYLFKSMLKHARKALIRMVSMRISSWPAYMAQRAHGRSMRVRNSILSKIWPKLKTNPL